MDYRLLLKKKYPTIDPNILSRYNLPEVNLVVNNDPNLYPIDISEAIPKPPEEHEIDSFGMPAHEQKYHRPEMPERLKRLILRNETSEEVWESLDEHQDIYEDEILWIKVQWHRILNGYWFYNNGTPMYISGIHYAYCGFWKIDIGLPEYRYRDRKFFLFGEYCKMTRSTFDPEYVNRHGKPVRNDEGHYVMKDLGRRVCAGFIYPKHRREGATYKASCYNYFTIIIANNATSGIVAADGDTALDVFAVKIKEPWKSLPFFLRPIYSGSTDNATELQFKPQAKKLSSKKGSLLGGGDGLQSRITYSSTAKRGFYDGRKLLFLHVDEAGKCLSIDTPVRLFDGRVIPVQDVVEGDLLMGPDFKKRTVTSTTRGREMMCRIIPDKWDEWGCNKSHILSVYTSHPQSMKRFGVLPGSIINITIKRYFEMWDSSKRFLSLYSVAPRQSRGKGHHSKSNFRVEKTGVGDYYGFTLKEDPLFLLGDYTVTHNTILENVDERNQVLMRTLEIGKVISGICIITSTVAEQKKQGGLNFKTLCDKSKWEDRNANGQTMSKLFVLFTSAAEGLEGFIDEYGYSVVNDPTHEQAKFINDKIGGLQYLENINNKLLSEGKIDAYNESLRQFPIKYRHCFIGDQSESGFNLMKINKRMEQLDDMQDATTRGNFIWATPRDGENPHVQWVPDAYGKWIISYLPPAPLRNQMYFKGGIWYPSNPNAYVTGVDPYRFTKVESARKSKGGGATFWVRDLRIDPPKRDVSKWQSHRFVCTYKNRVDSKKDFADDMLKQTVFYGGLCYPERNIPVIEDEWIDWGYGGFLKYDIDERGKESLNPGYYIGNNDKVKQAIFDNFMNYIEAHCERERHYEILDECKNIPGIEFLKEHDLFAAAGGSLYALNDSYGESPLLDETKDKKINANNYFRQFTYD